MKINLKNNIFFTIALIIEVASVQAQNASDNKEPGINVSFMDMKVKPGNDFFQFVNGGWLNKTEIPDDQAYWESFNELAQKTDKDVLNILKEVTKNAKYKSNTDQGKAVNLYKTIMDTVSRNKRGLSPLKPYLAKINAVKNIRDLQVFLIEMEPIGGIGFFDFRIGADPKNSNRNVVGIDPGSLGLPDRDYYVSDDKDSKEKRDRYVLHMAKMLQYLGEKPLKAKTDAEMILALETALSKPRFDRVERRDIRKLYNPMSVTDLQKLTPSIDWKNFLAQIGLTKTDTLIVIEPKYMNALETIFKENKVEDWKTYMRWTLLNKSTSKLSTSLETANWEFYGKTLTGVIKQRSYEDRALQIINKSVGEALGKLYVEKMFPAAAKANALKMITNILIAFENRINDLPWMSTETRVNAIAKLHKIQINVGYPDKWKDYSALTIKSPEEGGNYFENSNNLSRWSFKEDINKLNKPVDKTEWMGILPQIVNASSNKPNNSINFPAAILQPPFYNYQADEAVNYGGIGGVIGHEISHLFSDTGARYDADGNLKDWWTANDLKQFTVLTGALGNQYSVIEPLPGIHINGKLTLGENTADLGGVNVAYDGLQLYLKENGYPGLIDGFTPEQRFFISWATIWRTKIREEQLKIFLKTNPHSPGMYRAYVPLQNMDTFYKAFDIKTGDGMFIPPEKRVKIW